MRVTQRKVMSSIVEDKQRIRCIPASSGIKDDLGGILLLTFLYILQGIPLGLAAAIPYLLQADAHTANYKYQAIFSWVFWPFSLKLAWAPIIDSIYSSRLGRRKTWLIPIQYAIGIDLFVLANRVNNWLGRPEGQFWGPLGVTGEVKIWSLTCAFFGLTLLAATQDIVVDGWALTMLSKKNVGWASTCNSVGQSLGYIMAFIVFLALESPEVCNNYLRSVPVHGQGIISFSGFLYFWGIVFVLCTTAVALLKSEGGVKITECRKRKYSTDDTETFLNPQSGDSRDEDVADEINVLGGLETSTVKLGTRRSDGDFVFANNSCDNTAELVNETMINFRIKTDRARESTDEEKELSLWQTYRVMIGVIRLRPVLRYIAFVFMVKFVFSGADNIFSLKLLENGVSKEKLALMGTIVLPLQAVLPLLVTPWSNGPRPLGTYLSAAVPRAILAGLTTVILYYTPYFRQSLDTSGDTLVYQFSTSFYILILVKFAVYSVFSHTMFVCQMAYHARISDPSIGGTYMTLLNTAANLAGSLPATLMLYLVDPLTQLSCDGANLQKAVNIIHNSTLSSLTLPLTQVNALAQTWIRTNATCKAASGIEACRLVAGTCHKIVDGFYIEVGFCMLFGFVTYLAVLRKMAKSLDNLPISSYRLRQEEPLRSEN